MYFRGLGRATLAGVSTLALMSVSAVAQQAVETTVLPSGNVTQLDRLVIGVRSNGTGPGTGTVGQTPPAYSGGQVGAGTQLGMLGNRTVFEAPFSVSSFTEELIRNQQARSVADVTQNDPSVRNDAPVYSERDSFFIRGFSVTNLDTAYDGLFYIANPRRHFVEGIERVEVIKGPTALLGGGTGRVGGTINLVPKRAGEDPLTRLTTTYASDAQFGSHIDIGRRLGPNNEFGIRINGSYRNGDTPYDNHALEVGVASLGLDYRGERFRASLDVNHSTQNIDAPTSLFNSVAPGVEVPDAPNGRINLANPFEYHNSRYNMVAGRVEFDVLPNATLYAAAGASRYNEDFLTSSHRIINVNGDATSTLDIQPQQIEGLSGEIGLRTQFDTGPVSHRVNVAVSQSNNTSYRGGFVPAAVGLPGSYPNNIYDPVFLPDGSVDIDSLPDSSDLPVLADLSTTSLAISDTLSILDERFQLTLGGRFQNIDSEGFNTRPDRGPIGLKTYDYEETQFTPAIAASARVTDNLTIYANYIEALTEGPIAPPAASNAGEVFAPTINRQREIGVKYDAGTFGLTAALFEIEQPNGISVPGGRFDLDGLQVNRGLEMSVFGEPMEGVRLLGGITFMDAEVESSQGGLFDGLDARGVPEVAFTLYGEYDVPGVEGLTLNGRVVHTGSTFYDNANTQEVDAWTRVDVGARYEVEGPAGTPIELRANIENLFDEGYWASSARGWLAGGAPRTFTVSAAFEF